MQKFESIEEFEKVYDAAYMKALEEGTLDDFESLSFFAIRMYIAETSGMIKGMLEAIDEVGADPEIIVSIQKNTEMLNGCIEIVTQKMEALGWI